MFNNINFQQVHITPRSPLQKQLYRNPVSCDGSRVLLTICWQHIPILETGKIKKQLHDMETAARFSNLTFLWSNGSFIPLKDRVHSTSRWTSRVHTPPPDRAESPRWSFHSQLQLIIINMKFHNTRARFPSKLSTRKKSCCTPSTSASAWLHWYTIISCYGSNRWMTKHPYSLSYWPQFEKTRSLVLRLRTKPLSPN